MIRFVKQFTSWLKRQASTTTGISVQRLTPPDSVTDRANWDKKLVFSLAPKRFPNRQQLRYLPVYLNRREKLTLRFFAVLLLASVLALLVGVYQRHVVYLPKAGGTYSEGIVGQPAYVNPILAQSDIDRDFSRLIYSRLFTYNEEMELIPDLADRYELSEDKKTYTIYLRPDAYWHNGNRVLADDVVFTYATIADPQVNSPWYSSFRGVTINRLDDTTVSFTLEEPFTPFLSNLTIGILPAHLWADVPATSFHLAEYNTKPIGSGPFVFTELTKDRSGIIKTYTLERNKLYYRDTPYIEKLLFKLFADYPSAVTALKNGAIDGISYVPKEHTAELEADREITIYPLSLPQYSAVFFDQKNSLFKNDDLNKALALATDKERMLREALDGKGSIINGPISPGFLGATDDLPTYGYNPQRAAEVLDEQGWKVPESGGLRQKDGAELKFSLTTVDQPQYLKTADILRENWEAVNVGIELKIMNPNRVDKEVIQPRNFEAFLYGEILGADPDPYPFWHSSQTTNGLNLSSYMNKEADKLLEEARQLDNPDERAAKYIDFQKILVNDMPAIFLYSPSYDYAVDRRVKGIENKGISTPSERFTNIEHWYIKTRFGWK